MNSNKITTYLIPGLLAFVTIFSSCKKDKELEPPVSTNGTLVFHLHTMLDEAEVEAYGDTIMLDNGRKVSLSIAQLYISNIKLIKTDGTVVNGPDANVFLHQGEEFYELETVLSEIINRCDLILIRVMQPMRPTLLHLTMFCFSPLCGLVPLLSLMVSSIFIWRVRSIPLLPQTAMYLLHFLIKSEQLQIVSRSLCRMKISA